MARSRKRYTRKPGKSSMAAPNPIQDLRTSILTDKHFAPKGKITEWEPKDFKLEGTTVWSFPTRGTWATHKGDYRGNWAPEIPRNLILRYSKENDVVLDPFVGSGTTVIETKLLNRRGLGIDINPEAIRLAKERTKFPAPSGYEPKLLVGDVRNLTSIIENALKNEKDRGVDFICAHPPYANIIQYTENNPQDLSRLDIDEFVDEMGIVAKQFYGVLKSNKFCAILIGDTRRKGHMIPMGFRVMQKFLDTGFVLKELVIKQQHNCRTTGFWYNSSIKNNFLLMAHEYLFVFRKV